MLEVTDDSGFLALVDPDAYRSFVAADFAWEQILAHFRGEMSDKHMLIWATGMEHTWRIDSRLTRYHRKASREVVGSIRASSGRLLVTNYEDLTMAAQFPDISLPEELARDQLLLLPEGFYQCRIMQLEGLEHTTEQGPHFVIELTPAIDPIQDWKDIPWVQ